MGFLSFIVLLAIAYLVWRVTDQLPDLIFRLSEIQRDVAEIRRRLAEQGVAGEPATGPRASSDAATGPGSTTGGLHGDETGADYTGS
jgi:hypothetical protein